MSGAEEPERLTPKQESFVRHYLETGNASEAYKRAYNVRPSTSGNAIRVTACRLLQQPNISLMIERRKAKAAEKCEISLADIAGMLQDAVQVAKSGGDPGAMTEAAMSLAKLLGHYTEKKHVTSDNRNHNLEERVSPTAEWITGVLGDPAEASSAKSRTN